MNELIKITHTEGKQTVNARDLHAFLEVKTEFSHWIKRRIAEYGFTIGTDYVVAKNGERVIIDKIEYYLSIDMAKELSMVERNEKGQQARQYFIACEKELKTFVLPQTFSQALLLASQQAEQIEQQTALLLEQQSKVEFHDAVTGSKTTTDLGTVAKVLNYPGMGRNNLFEFLRENKILMTNNRPYQRFVDSGHFRVVESRYIVNLEERISFRTVVFQKGIKMIKKLLDESAK